MNIDIRLQIKAYELLIKDMQEQKDKIDQDFAEYVSKQVTRLSLMCDFVDRELGYDRLMEVAKIIDSKEKNCGDIVGYVQDFYSK